MVVVVGVTEIVLLAGSLESKLPPVMLHTAPSEQLYSRLDDSGTTMDDGLAVSGMLHVTGGIGVPHEALQSG